MLQESPYDYLIGQHRPDTARQLHNFGEVLQLWKEVHYVLGNQDTKT